MEATSPYLTVAEAATELSMTPDGVRKLIKRRVLRATKLSERKTLISRAALRAYQARLNGDGPDPVVTHADPDDLVAAFAAETGMAPGDWLAAYKNDRFEDTAQNMVLLAQAASLIGNASVALAEQAMTHASTSH
jgi:excisionase family DNA binding protein